ncbi:MAG: hypothetical protein V1722_03760 [Candidatus Micrarchaeota archaeon]
MPVEWKTTRVGDTVVHHWKRHNPREILAALAEEPIETKGETPQVRRYKLGKLNLAVRQLPRVSGYATNTGKLFATLKQMQRERMPIIEVPVAIIKEPANVFKVVTVWKKGANSLLSWVNEADLSSRVSLNEVRDVANSVARKVAQLHVAGYAHGNLKLDNFVITPSGVPLLVDFTKLQKVGKQSLPAKRGDNWLYGHIDAGELNLLFDNFASLQVAKLKTKNKTERLNFYRQAVNDLWSEYSKWYTHYSGIKE